MTNYDEWKLRSPYDAASGANHSGGHVAWPVPIVLGDAGDQSDAYEQHSAWTDGDTVYVSLGKETLELPISHPAVERGDLSDECSCVDCRYGPDDDRAYDESRECL